MKELTGDISAVDNLEKLFNIKGEYLLMLKKLFLW